MDLTYLHMCAKYYLTHFIAALITLFIADSYLSNVRNKIKVIAIIWKHLLRAILYQSAYVCKILFGSFYYYVSNAIVLLTSVKTFMYGIGQNLALKYNHNNLATLNESHVTFYPLIIPAYVYKRVHMYICVHYLDHLIIVLVTLLLTSINQMLETVFQNGTMA